MGASYTLMVAAVVAVPGAALANSYKVEEWSEKHWQLMERSMHLPGELGIMSVVEVPTRR